ncbi:AAA family ATPase [Celerinatantimonas sp. YJH-8]|uniref:AAA family ATPase n=1 Tax=Celerinatantimonas sp. YJH-8 TaxID=3228714 RepID=UPI0038C56860
MRLKSIRLAGFKSFVEPTKIPFPQQLTGVVGPNGCGKSNVIDAVRWVLGESSARNLRGDAMTDVIFNGSTRRAPASKASVELEFDNQSGRLTGEFGAYTEVSVRREVTRDGQNLYFLNGTKCRKKDITDLFLGTGLGPRSYAIIEQGMISRLIESKPQELRVFIDEAAGVSKYKERRRETENRIRHTEENLLRLSDIESELTERVQKLRIQAQAALKFRQLRDQQRHMERQQSLLQLRQLDQALDQKGQAQQTDHQQLALAEARLTELEDHQLLVTEQQHELTEQLDQLRQQEAETAAELARHEQQLLHYSQNEKQRQSQQQQLKERLTQWQNECEQRQQHQPQQQQQLEQLDLQIEMTEQQLQELSEQMEEVDLQRQQADEKWRFSQQQFQQVQRQLITYTEQHRSAGLRSQQAVQRIQELQQQQPEAMDPKTVADAELQLEQLAEVIAQLDEQLSAGEQRRLASQQALADIEQQLQQAKQHAFELSTQYQSQQQLLKSLTEHQYPSQQPLKSQLVIQTGWEIAAEKVLGPWLFAETADTAALEASLAVFGDFIQQCDDPTQFAYYIQGAPAFLIQHIKIATSRAEAEQMRATLKQNESVITQAGEWLGPSWQHTFSESQRPSVLAVQARLEQLEIQLPQQEQIQADLEDQQQFLQQQRDMHEQQMKQLQLQSRDQQQRMSQLQQQLALAKQQQQHYQHQLHQLQQQLQQAQAQLESAQNEESLLAEQVEQQQLQAEQKQEQLLEYESYAQQCQQASKQRSGQLHQLENQLHQWQLKRQQLASELAQLSAWLSDRQQQMAEIHVQLAALSEAEYSVDHLEQLQLQIDRFRQLQLQRQQQRESLEAQRSQFQQQLAQLGTELKVGQKEKEAVQQQQQQHLLARQELLTRRGLLAEKLAQMGVTLSGTELEEIDLTVDYVAELEKIERQLKRLGAVNLAAESEYEEQQGRLSELSAQMVDLREALEMLNSAISQIDRQTRSKFRETFDKVNQDLQHLFPQVFGGGTAWLELTEEHDLLETGVTIMARPPGKKNSTISLLSGGEKALTALSLVFAIFRLNPAPFCMLDEVDAPLDEVNVGRFADLIARMSETVQFIFISHNRVTMEKADQLAGVTMQEPGVSRLVAVNIAQAIALAE